MQKLLTVIALGLVSFTANADEGAILSYKIADIDIETLNENQQVQLRSEREIYLSCLEFENSRRIVSILTD